MLQAQARTEDQAVQLHEKLEAKRAATHADKVRVYSFHYHQASNITHSAAHLFNQSVTQSTNQTLTKA